MEDDFLLPPPPPKRKATTQPNTDEGDLLPRPPLKKYTPLYFWHRAKAILNIRIF